MADSLAQQVFNLVRRLAKRFNRKISEIILILVNQKGASSLGAIAGFAIAIIFTWKFLRPSGKPQRSQHKQTDLASTSDVTAPVNELCQSDENGNELDSVDELHSPKKLALGQTIRKKLIGSRKMTCQLLGVILEQSSPEELQEFATVRPSVVEVLLEISKSCDIYLMERLFDDESEERVLLALENAGLFRTGSLMKNKVLFCSTENGRASFVRQLEPDWHVDTNPDIISQLSRFIRYQLHISPTRSSVIGSNVFNSMSLDHYFCEEEV